MRPRAATLAVFFVNGAVVGTWIASIPGIKSSLSASATEIGLVLLGAAFGSLLAQQVTGQLLMRRSSRGILVASALVLPWLVPLPVMAPDLATLALALFVFGYVNSTMDVAMNAHGLALETGGGRSILSGLHAGWSLGAFGGALGMATAVALGFGAVAEALMAAGVLWLVALLASRSLGTGSVRTAGASGVHRPSRRALPVALLIIPVAFVAGGIADWGGVYLRQGAGSSAEVAAFAFAAYSLGLFLGRSAGDLIKD
ncbi:MAG: MFS transporter, partial [Candidatus Limnocylindrales bacterium]